MAILIVGEESQVATQVAKVYGQNQCLTTSRRESARHRVDLFFPKQAADVVSGLCDSNDICVVIIVAGATNVDWCESHAEEARAANSDAPRLIARVASSRGIRTVFFSTDYVFDGDSGPYYESAAPNPINIYGRTKLLGEMAVLQECPGSLVVRSTWVYGADSKRRNFMYRVFDHDYAASPLAVSAVEHGSPTWNKDLAVATVLLEQRRCEGIFHVAGPEYLSRYQFAYLLSNSAGLRGAIRACGRPAVPATSAKRPVLGGLVSERLPDVIPTFNSTDVQSVVGQVVL